MILFHYETDFVIENESNYADWIVSVIQSEEKIAGEINYIFCDDDYLYDININYLNHNTLTDIISFDYTDGATISGDIFISVERVKENAAELGIDFHQELLRVMAHGVLHYCGYKDKSDEDAKLMRTKEDEKIKMFHVEQ
ncbi:MAG TPA: rRNA maturation RNase YbeY [Flavobacterium sp.]|nr:rRNA maturation RNase YbeY [Flavobacterium sp.]